MLDLRKTKIICTLGPAVDSEEMVRALIRGGMNAARFNFSHGSHAEHLERLNRLKAIRDAMGRPVATILDTTLMHDTQSQILHRKSFLHGLPQ